MSVSVQITCFCIFTRTGKGSGNDVTSSNQISNGMVSLLAAHRGRTVQKQATRVFISGFAILLLALLLVVTVPGETFYFWFFRDAPAPSAGKGCET